jgi:hypothetical protein
MKGFSSHGMEEEKAEEKVEEKVMGIKASAVYSLRGMLDSNRAINSDHLERNCRDCRTTECGKDGVIWLCYNNGDFTAFAVDDLGKKNNEFYVFRSLILNDFEQKFSLQNDSHVAPYYDFLKFYFTTRKKIKEAYAKSKGFDPNNQLFITLIRYLKSGAPELATHHRKVIDRIENRNSSSETELTEYLDEAVEKIVTELCNKDILKKFIAEILNDCGDDDLPKELQETKKNKSVKKAFAETTKKAKKKARKHLGL